MLREQGEEEFLRVQEGEGVRGWSQEQEDGERARVWSHEGVVAREGERANVIINGCKN